MHGKPIILNVSSNRRNLELLAQLLEREGYQAHSVESLEALDQLLSGAEKVSLALVDLTDFDKSIWDRCERLRNAKIPFLVISPQQSANVQRQTLAQGARGMLVKPLVMKEFLQLIRGLVAE